MTVFLYYKLLGHFFSLDLLTYVVKGEDLLFRKLKLKCYINNWVVFVLENN